jgi:hypothetical protein
MAIMYDIDHLTTLAIKHLGITTPVVAAEVKGAAFHVILLGGQELSCKLSDLEHAPAPAAGRPAKPKKKLE